MSVALRSPKVDIDTSGWRDATVGACSELVSTGPFGSLLHKWDYIEGGVPVINPVNLVDGEIRCDSRVTVSKAKAAELSAYRVRLGDILVARRGDIGRCAVATVVNNGWLCGTGCFFIRPSLATDPRFLALLLGSPEYQEKLQAASTGTTMLNLSNRALSELALRVPPLEEQKRIVAVLDQAFAALDRARANAEANLADAQALFEATKQTVLDGASEGGSLVSLAEVSTIDSSLVDPRDAEYIDLPHIGAGNMCMGSGELIGVMTAREEKLKSGKYLFDDEDVLYSKIRPYLRKVARPTFSGLCSADVYPIRPAESLDRNFLFHLLLGTKFTKYAESGSARAGMPKVNREHLFRYEFRLPSLAKQRRAVAKIDVVLEKASELRLMYDRKATDLAALRQSLLQKAFAGELA